MAPSVAYSWSDRLRMAKTYKEEGNAKYRNYVYPTAIGKYRLALLYLDDDTRPMGYDDRPSQSPISEHQLEELKHLKVDCLNNLAGAWRSNSNDSAVGYIDSRPALCIINEEKSDSVISSRTKLSYENKSETMRRTA